jgi:hypothetical protein
MKTTQATQIIRKTNELELLPSEKEVTNEAPATDTKQLLKIINEGGKCKIRISFSYKRERVYI